MTFGISFSESLGISSDWFRDNKVFNPTLDKDTPLFIDPFLLDRTAHKNFGRCSKMAFSKRFKDIIQLLSASRRVGDPAWNAAFKRFHFSERGFVSGTCLGYGKNSTSGHAFGKKKAQEALLMAKQIIDLGVDNPDLFPMLSLFNDGVGCDLISDMVSVISFSCIVDFTTSMINKIESDTGVKIPTSTFTLRDNRDVSLYRNIYSNNPKPVFLLPSDILRNLPVLDDVRMLPKAADQNSSLRDRVNESIGSIWKIKTKKDKEEVKRQALESKEAFLALVELIKITESTGYNVAKDPDGLLQWRELSRVLVLGNPLKLSKDDKRSDLENVCLVVDKLIEHFRHIVEDQRMSRVFYVDGEPRKEKFAQLLFFAMSSIYCEENNIGISPEADAGAGPVDFKFSGGKSSVLVEIKLSTNSKIVHGYQKQLTAYQAAEKTDAGHYVVIDVGKLGKKWEDLERIAKGNKEFGELRKIHLIDGSLRASASKLD